ncbi:uncharacterized protein LOC132640777 isoform X2 [Lycium barbarum]|uniref:uncharacterized protein LOC132640777 isoform X2 n=1 Tax=Lycium barbarum TaxID=112863 RepID=UPI00293E0D56|nr:uncharacterized protein LOC132640777 isoform X2 [Lycium barbarum]
MYNFPPSLILGPRRRNLGMVTPEELIMYLIDINLRGDVLIHLNKLIKQMGENCIDLALELWNSFNTVYILLQEVTAVYQRFSTSTLTMEESTRVRNALAVLQCMASHPEARWGLIKANIPHYLYPFIQISTNEKPLEFVRPGSLDLIGALAKFDDQYGPEILNFFLDTQLFPRCLHCMDHGDKLTGKVVRGGHILLLYRERELYMSSPFALKLIKVIKRIDTGVEH